MDIIIILSEFISLAAIAAFSGVLESKYYEKVQIKYLFGGIVAAMFVWAVLMYPDTPLDGSVPHWMGLHVAFNALMLCLYGYASVQFSKIHLKYEAQYLVARWILGVGSVAEFVAIAAVIWALC